MKKTKAKASGKIILVGEHAVVHGYPAILSSIDRYYTCIVSESSTPGISLEEEGYSKNSHFTWEEIKKWIHNPLKKTDKSLPAVTLKVFLNEFQLQEFPDIKIEVSYGFPTGGYGASTAYIVCIVRALMKYLNIKFDSELVYSLAMKTESTFHGYSSSGVDQAAIVYGGLVMYQKIYGRNKIKKLELQSKLLRKCLIIDSGQPGEATGDVVTFVLDRLNNEPKKIHKIFNDMEDCADRLLLALQRNTKKAFYKQIDIACEALIDLGVVLPSTIKLIRSIQKIGGHVKVSGAGALTGKGSGALICFGEIEAVEEILEKQKLDYVETSLG